MLNSTQIEKTPLTGPGLAVGASTWSPLIDCDGVDRGAGNKAVATATLPPGSALVSTSTVEVDNCCGGDGQPAVIRLTKKRYRIPGAVLGDPHCDTDDRCLCDPYCGRAIPFLWKAAPSGFVSAHGEGWEDFNVPIWLAPNSSEAHQNIIWYFPWYSKIPLSDWGPDFQNLYPPGRYDWLRSPDSISEMHHNVVFFTKTIIFWRKGCLHNRDYPTIDPAKTALVLRCASGSGGVFGGTVGYSSPDPACGSSLILKFDSGLSGGTLPASYPAEILLLLEASAPCTPLACAGLPAGAAARGVFHNWTVGDSIAGTGWLYGGNRVRDAPMVMYPTLKCTWEGFFYGNLGAGSGYGSGAFQLDAKLEYLGSNEWRARVYSSIVHSSIYAEYQGTLTPTDWGPNVAKTLPLTVATQSLPPVTFTFY